jgi:hypothetical protein
VRWYSTPQSSANGEITWLAIAECLVSIAIYVGIGIHTGTFKALAWAVAFAPLMLFRTNESAKFGLELFERFGYWSDTRGIRVLNLFLLYAMGPVAAVLIRVWSTIYWVIRAPMHALRQMPENWIRQSLCTDFAHPPEILPGESIVGSPFLIFVEEMRGEAIGDFTANSADVRAKSLYYAINNVFDVFDITLFIIIKMLRYILCILLFLPYLAFGYLPSLLYRVSFKATSLAYAPFVWVAHTTLLNQLSIKVRLERFTKGEFEKVRRWFSASVLTILACKFGFMLGLVPLTLLLAHIPSQQIIDRFIQPSHLPWWQITLLTDALLTYVLLWFADAALGRLDDAHPWPERLVTETLSAGSFLRSALSILTMSHFCFLALAQIIPNSIRGVLTR